MLTRASSYNLKASYFSLNFPDGPIERSISLLYCNIFDLTASFLIAYVYKLIIKTISHGKGCALGEDPRQALRKKI